MLIEASITAGIRPTSLILHTQPGKKWDKFDFLCIEAYQIVQNERCGQCGLPRWMCHNDSDDIRFKVVDDTCFAMKQVEKQDEKKSSVKGYKAPHGVKTRAEPFRPSGDPLDGVMREAFYKAEYEKANPESQPDVA